MPIYPVFSHGEEASHQIVAHHFTCLSLFKSFASWFYVCSQPIKSPPKQFSIQSCWRFSSQWKKRDSLLAKLGEREEGLKQEESIISGNHWSVFPTESSSSTDVCCWPEKKGDDIFKVKKSEEYEMSFSFQKYCSCHILHSWFSYPNEWVQQLLNRCC